MVPVTPREIFRLKQWNIDFRFVREVELLERDGRVSSREDLERAIGMEHGGLATVRQGMRGVSLVNVVVLFEKYRGDKDYIMFGAARNPELTNPYIPGIGRLSRYDPYYHTYNSVARWRIGPQPETHHQYYEKDPLNKLWVAPARKSIASVGDQSNSAE